MNFLMLTEGDNAQKAIQSYNLLSIIITAVVVGLIIAAFSVLISAGKKSTRPTRTNRNLDMFKTTKGKITKIEEEIFYVKPYVHRPQLMTDADKKSNKKTFSAVEKQIEQDAVKEQSKPVEKTRYKIRYSFAVEGLGDGFGGECFVFEKNDDIEEGKTIKVIYDPVHPQVNYTDYSMPV